MVAQTSRRIMSDDLYPGFDMSFHQRSRELTLQSYSMRRRQCRWVAFSFSTFYCWLYRQPLKRGSLYGDGSQRHALVSKELSSSSCLQDAAHLTKMLCSASFQSKIISFQFRIDARYPADFGGATRATTIFIG